MNTPIQSRTSPAPLNGVALVICNCPDTATAERLAHGLIENRLAACVNRLSPVLSIYRWDGRVETAEEYPLHIKTTVDACPQLLAWLVAHHPYDVPEIIVLPVTDGLPAYLAWVHNEVNA